jgi:hypothetical protein
MNELYSKPKTFFSLHFALAACPTNRDEALKNKSKNRTQVFFFIIF